MNKLILVFTAIAFTVGACSQTDSTNKKMGSTETNYGTDQNRDKNNNQNQNVQNNSDDKTYSDGVLMQNGKMMMVRNGQMSILGGDMTMSNGTKIMSDGSYLTKDGTKMTMKEGQHLDMSGNMIPIKTKTMYLVPDSAR